MEALQNLLTIAIETVAIAGFTGIIAHAIWKQHTNWMTQYCPPVAPYKPDTQVAQPKMTEVPVIVEPQPIHEDVWDCVVEPTKVVCLRPVSRHFSAQLALPPAQEEVKPKKSRKTPALPKAPAKPRTTRKRKTA